MKRTLLGQSGLDVPVFAVGTGAMKGMAVADGVPILRRAYALGATWWDTSDDYGTHPMVAQALVDFPRTSITISTKTWAKTRREGEESIRQILAELGTPYVDILFLHYVQSEEDWQARQGCLEALLDAKANGTVRAIGLSSHFPAVVARAADFPLIDVVLAPWNRFGELPDGGSLMEEAAGIRACYAAGKGVILMKLLASGRLRGMLDDAIRAGVAFPEKHAVDIGVRSIVELETDIRLVLGEPVDQSILEHLKAGERFGHAA